MATKFRRHPFSTTDFWRPWCSLCHEREPHPIHQDAMGTPDICGATACRYCIDIDDPERGLGTVG